MKLGVHLRSLWMSYCSNQAHIFTKFRNLQFKADIAEFGCQNPFFLSLNYCVKVLLQCACASAQWHTYGHAQKNYVCFYSLVLFPCVMFDLDFRCVYLPQDTIHSLTALCEVCRMICFSSLKYSFYRQLNSILLEGLYIHVLLYDNRGFK